MRDFAMLINGRPVAGDSTMPVINPSTGEAIAACPCASRQQAEQAIAAAKAAFPAWSECALTKRRELVYKVADAVESRVDELAKLLTLEQGKPLADARMEVLGTAAFIRYYAGLDLAVEVIESSETRHVEAHRRPLGVVVAITPWNFPVLLFGTKIAPALLAGNTVVIKPAPTTPLTSLFLGEIIGGLFPPGVINVIADQNDLGDLLTSHPDVSKITFTGSTATGRKIMASAAPGIKRLTLELGGNDAAIVLDDIDVKAAAAGIFGGAFFNAGQACLAIKRLYVHESIYDEMCSELAALADAVVLGDGMQEGVQMGPVQNRMQYERVKGLIDDARRRGSIVTGGEVPDRPGYFIRPTIIRDVAEGDRIVDEEQFGPALPVIKYSDTEDAINRANASCYGLGGSVWGKDTARARALAARIQAGSVFINKHLDFSPSIPFGGAKQSGIGVEFCEDGLLEFTQLQILNAAR